MQYFLLYSGHDKRTIEKLLTTGGNVYGGQH